MGATIASLVLSYFVGHCYSSQMEMSTDGLFPLAVYTVLSGTMEARLQESGFQVVLSSTQWKCVLSVQCLQ